MLTALEVKCREKWGKHKGLSKGGKDIPVYIILILSVTRWLASFSPCSHSPLLASSHFCTAEVSSATAITDFAMGDLLCHQLRSSEVFEATDFGSPLPKIQWPLSFSVPGKVTSLQHVKVCLATQCNFSSCCFCQSFATLMMHMEIFTSGFCVTSATHAMLQGCALLWVKNIFFFPLQIYHL